jgi:uncharacterized protein (DUF2267 family)
MNTEKANTETEHTEDLAYLLLKKIAEANANQGKHPHLELTPEDLGGKELTPTDLQDYLVYLNQKGYIHAEFTSEHYPDRDQSPGLANVKSVVLTNEGRRVLKEIERGDESGEAIASKDAAFLEKVMIEGKLEDIFDARDLTEVVFRIMRDLMTTEAAERVTDELHEEAMHSSNKALQVEIKDLWHDTNPLVSFLSQIRPPWQGPGVFKIDSDRFLFRVANEGGMPSGTNAETVTKAVFTATKAELSDERIVEVATFLPGVIRQLWETA